MVKYAIRGGFYVKSKIIREKQKDEFYKELGLNNYGLEILLKIENDKASYFDGNEYHELDLVIAEKYINAQ